MIVLGIALIAFACFLGYKIKQDRFNRTNASGVLEYDSFGHKVRTDMKHGFMNQLSVVVGLIGVGIVLWSIFMPQ